MILGWHEDPDVRTFCNCPRSTLALVLGNAFHDCDHDTSRSVEGNMDCDRHEEQLHIPCIRVDMVMFSSNLKKVVSGTCMEGSSFWNAETVLGYDALGRYYMR
mmetsp:Transcript_31222/g.41309  ORF Transcript_31222/g.41309 Transcript_31222/m.41309 type:complete len:103 (-) Transcript_31222:788-1096(-)